MKLALFFTTTFLSSVSMAKPDIYKLNMTMAINGKPASSLTVVAAEDKKASIIQTSNGEKTFFDVVAKNTSGSLVTMEFAAGTVSQSGVRNVISTPRIIAPLDEPAEITAVNEDGTSVSIAVTASKL